MAVIESLLPGPRVASPPTTGFLTKTLNTSSQQQVLFIGPTSLPWRDPGRFWRIFCSLFATRVHLGGEEHLLLTPATWAEHGSFRPESRLSSKKDPVQIPARNSTT